ncbi:MAG: uroporphyrinogen decarboxylase family protein [Lentisphaeria bacterium]
MSLSPRENLLSLWRRQGYEYAPASFQLCPLQIECFHAHYGSDASYPDTFSFPLRYLESSFIKAKEQDWSRYYPCKIFHPGTNFSIWGVANEPAPGSLHITRMHHPMENLSSLEQFQSYPYPEMNPADEAPAKAEIQSLHERGLVAAAPMSCTVWEIGWYLRGMEALMMDLITEDPIADYHLERLTEIACCRVQLFAAAGVDLICLGDDVGMQKALLLSPGHYRSWLKARLTRIIRAAKAINPRVLISYHSCGYITPLIPDLIEAGIDVLDPVQPECMPFEEIYQTYGDVLSFSGTLGTQTTLPFDSPENVRKVTLRNLEIAGNRGGLLCSPTHMIEPEVPWENLEAYLQALRDFSASHTSPALSENSSASQ